MTAGGLYTRLLARFERAGLPTPDADARALLAHRLSWERTDLPLHRHDRVPLSARVLLLIDTARRCRHEPVALITGYKDFYRDRFSVSHRTLIPRADTEHLLYAVEESGRKFGRILDIGTGTGCLALSLAGIFPDAQITALDVDVRTALLNRRLLNREVVTILRCDFLSDTSIQTQPELAGPFDLVISNPPYLSAEDFRLLDQGAKFEHRRAFAGGSDGLAFYREITRFCKEKLASNGWIVVETDHKWKDVAEIFRLGGFSDIEVRQDYNGLERVIVAKRTSA